MSCPRPLFRVVSPDRRHRYEGAIFCQEHLRQVIPDGDPPVQQLDAEQAAFWGHRCLMCGVEPAPDRLCENENCRRPLHPQWQAVYCSNDCALEDV